MHSKFISLKVKINFIFCLIQIFALKELAPISNSPVHVLVTASLNLGSVTVTTIVLTTRTKRAALQWPVQRNKSNAEAGNSAYTNRTNVTESPTATTVRTRPVVLHWLLISVTRIKNSTAPVLVSASHALGTATVRRTVRTDRTNHQDNAELPFAAKIISAATIHAASSIRWSVTARMIAATTRMRMIDTPALDPHSNARPASGNVRE